MLCLQKVNCLIGLEGLGVASLEEVLLGVGFEITKVPRQS